MRLLEFYNKVDNSVGVAKVLFNFLSQNYPSKKLKDIAKTTSGGTPNRSISAYYGGNIPWIKSGELNDGLITESEEKITEDALKNSSAKLYPKGTLVLALYGATVGKTGILAFESASNQAVCAVYPEKGVSKEYLFWFFRQKRFEYIQQSFGGAQPNISQDVVKNTDVPLPPLEVQESVQKLLFHIEKTKQVMDVKEYSAIIPYLKEFLLIKDGSDDVKEIYTDNFDIITNLRRTILSEAIHGKLVSQDVNDEPATELFKRIVLEKNKLIKEKKVKKEREFDNTSAEEKPFELPKGWTWAKLGEICYLITDGTHYTPSYVGSGVPFLSVKDVGHGKIDFSNCKYISEKEHEELTKRCKPEYMDILLTKVGTTGIAIVVDTKQEFSIFVSVALLKYPLHLIYPYYLEHLINSPFVKNQSDKGTEGIGNKNLVLRKIVNFDIPLPPFNEQKRIVEKVDQLMRLCDELEIQVKESQNNSEMLMESVLKEAFGAKI